MHKLLLYVVVSFALVAVEPPLAALTEVYNVSPTVIAPGPSTPWIQIRRDGIGTCPALVDPCLGRPITFNGVPVGEERILNPNAVEVRTALDPSWRSIEIRVQEASSVLTIKDAIRVSDDPPPGNPAFANIDPQIAWSDQRVTLRATAAWNSNCQPQPTTTVNGRIIHINIVAPELPQCYPTVPAVNTVTLTAKVGPLAPGVYEVRLNMAFGPGQSQESLVRMLYVRDAEAAFVAEPQVLFYSMDQAAFRWKEPPPFCGVLSCAPSVTIGGMPATIVRSEPSLLVVAVPNVGPGTFDAVITQGGVSYVARAAVTLARQDNIPPTLLERVLVPVLWAGPGALGSQWNSDVWFHNENPYPVISTDLTIGICNSLVSPCPYMPLFANETLHIDAQQGASYPNGLQLFVPLGSADGLRTTALVRDLSRQAEALGAELPIVRERDYLDKPFSLVRVATNPNFRTALRIYGTRGGTIRVRIFAIEEFEPDRLLLDQQMNLASSNNPRVPPVSFFPDVVAVWPQLRGTDTVRIEISGAERLWAFASVTNNITQHVTTIRPQ